MDNKCLRLNTKPAFQFFQTGSHVLGNGQEGMKWRKRKGEEKTVQNLRDGPRSKAGVIPEIGPQSPSLEPSHDNEQGIWVGSLQQYFNSAIWPMMSTTFFLNH